MPNPNFHCAGQPPATVIVLHGALIGSWYMRPFNRRLRDFGFQVHNLGYASRRLTLEAAAATLRPTLEFLAGRATGPVHLVGHSLGGLVCRRLLSLWQPPNLGRVVTLGSPHLGSPLADRFIRRAWFRHLFGPASADLVTGWPLDRLGPWPPPYELGLVAGHLPILPVNWLLGGPGDGQVPAVSSQPPGAAAYATVTSSHILLPFLNRTASLTANFLVHGRFSPLATEFSPAV